MDARRMASLVVLAAALAGCSDRVKSSGDTGTSDVPDAPDTSDAQDAPDSSDAQDVPEEPGPCDGHEGAVFCEGTVAVTCSEEGEVVSEQECDDGRAGHCEDGVGCVTPSYEHVTDIAAMYCDDTLEDSVGVVLVAGESDVTGETFDTSRFRMRPVTLAVTWELTEGQVSIVATSGNLRLYRTDGTEIALPASLDVTQMPLDFLVHATAPTDGTITARFTPPWDLPTSEDVLRVRAVRSPGIAGRPLAGYPYFEFVDAFNDDEVVSAALDPNRFPDRVGFGYDIYVVAHRTPAEWAVDSTLADASGATEACTVVAGSIADNRTDAWSTGLAAGTEVGEPYDMVLDFGRDGTLDPGDMIDGLYSSQAGLYVVKDLALPGPHRTTAITYSSSWWLTQKTYYPQDIASLGVVPLVVISHGNGHEYTWYDYIGEHLASYGYVVMSHRNDTRPGIETASTTTLTNTDHILGNLSTIGGGVLSGHVDGHRIAWIGHSRGGEGVVRAYDRLRDGVYTPANYDATDIVLISSIAPTVFYTVLDSDPHDVDYHLIAGAADGDVRGSPDCLQCQSFRLSQAADGNVQVTYVQGAGHNDFNCCGFDDATGPDLIGRAEAQQVAKSYFLALVEHYLMGNVPAKEYFTRMYDGFHPSGIAEHVVVASTYRDALFGGNYFLDDYQAGTSTTVASSGAAVAFDVSNVVEGKLADGDLSLEWTGYDPMNGMTQAAEFYDAGRGVVFDWTSTAYYEIHVMAGHEDFSTYSYLSFRACQGSRHPYTVALDGPLDFTVTLVDGSGGTSSIGFDEYGSLTTPYKRAGIGAGEGWANEFGSVRIRLIDFETDGPAVDLTNIVMVRFEFGGTSGSAQGRIGLDDVELTR